ncbi:hypothetical protein F2P81_001863 [Scophthalmus maximus]|uniref:Uncharacterized protein n=1 Tax=Scophthalmus maximus TaxID=52904 RepID=A0A6A4TQ40_SCOMX|nr:hypothetical protein F2P81_001863 [Scophthalmus maximus]
MPEKFNCVFRDSFKVFVVRGKPKPLGAKLSFSLNIISFFWSIAVFSVTVFQLQYLSILDSHHETLFKGVIGLMMSLLVFENSVAAFLIYWMSKAICREDFNTLPIILLKQRD